MQLLQSRKGNFHWKKVFFHFTMDLHVFTWKKLYLHGKIDNQQLSKFTFFHNPKLMFSAKDNASQMKFQLKKNLE